MKSLENNREINFIACHYRESLFAVEPALEKIRPRERKWPSIRKVAAILIAVVAFGAMAAALIQNFASSPKPETETPVKEENTVAPVGTPAADSVKTIDFENADLAMVVETINSTYNVRVGNLPENAADYHLTLHYEGTATDLIETINEILNINLTLSK